MVVVRGREVGALLTRWWLYFLYWVERFTCICVSHDASMLFSLSYEETDVKRCWTTYPEYTAWRADRGLEMFSIENLILNFTWKSVRYGRSSNVGVKWWVQIGFLPLDGAANIEETKCCLNADSIKSEIANIFKNSSRKPVGTAFYVKLTGFKNGKR